MEITGTPCCFSISRTADRPPWPRSIRSSEMTTPATIAPCPSMMSNDSRTAVPAVNTSSTISTRPADEIPPFSVIFCLLAIECERHVAAFARQGHRRPRGKDDAFVGGTEQHVELHTRGEDGFCVELRQALERRPGIEEARIEKIRSGAPGLGDEPAELQSALLDAEGDE